MKTTTVTCDQCGNPCRNDIGSVGRFYTISTVWGRHVAADGGAQNSHDFCDADCVAKWLNEVAYNKALRDAKERNQG